MTKNRNIKDAHSNVELKDGRRLLTFNNGFTYFVLSRTGKLEQVTQAYYRMQIIKNRKTKRNAKKQ